MFELPGIQWDPSGNAFALRDNFEGSKLLMSEWIKNDPLGVEFAEKFNTTANVEKLGQQLKFHNMVVSSNTLGWTFSRLRDSGQLTTPAQETAAKRQSQPDVPRDKNGKALTQAQIEWGEHRAFSETHSMQQVRDRARTDKSFAAFIQTNREREFESVGDAGIILDGSLHLSSVRGRSSR